METDALHELSERDRRDLAALADGLLTGRRAAALEARIASEPALAAALARQRIASTTTRDAAAAVSAPSSLRERVDAAPRARASSRRRRALVPVVAALAVAALAAVLVLPSGTPGGPSVVEAAQLGRLPAVEPAPRPATAKLLDRQAAGLPFPDWSQKFGWRATGARTDTLDGRRTTTVFYAKGARRIAYTIVGGAALREPDGSDRTVEGTRVRLVRAGQPALVTWQRRGHTCVLSGTADPETLRKLAAWKGKGAVEF
jgi:anti-sigma factor RsiW